MNRKRVILAGLLAFLVLCLIYAYREMPRLEKAPPRDAVTSARPQARTDDRSSASNTERIMFPRPDEQNAEYAGAKRDIFRFDRQYRSVAPTTVKAPTPAALPPVAPPPVEVQPDQIPFAVVQEELSKFTFLGFLEKAGEKTVFLTSGGTLFLAKKHESFGVEGEFTVAAIDGNLLKVRRARHDNLIEIPLIEKQKLAATISAPARLAPLASPVDSMPLRTMAPRPKVGKPENGAGTEVFEPVIMEENNPTEQQVPEPPAEGDVIEGEGNGKKQ